MAIEEQFYLLAPFAVRLLSRRALLLRDATGVAMLRRHATTLRRSLPLLLAGCVALSQLWLAGTGRTVLFTIGLSYLVLTALVLLLVVTHHPGSITGRISRATALVWIGRRSYFLYLFHMPLIALLRILPATFPVRVVVAIAFLLMLAEASWRYVEAPILSVGRRFRYA